jgi:site-specific DNA-methyltransferase (adenine-specific)
MSTSQVLVRGDCVETMRTLPDASIDAVVCDPPYELSFMGKAWDATGVAFRVETWREVWRVLKPGGYLLAFGGTRTYHRMTCAIEDAGFEIRDCLSYQYGSGFPKSLSVSSAIDKAARGTPQGSTKGDPLKRGKGTLPPREVFAKGGKDGGATTGLTDDYDAYVPATDAARRWSGWGTALKPAWEPIVVARRPLEGTVAANVLKYGTGALNIDACRVDGDGGRWPANVLLSCPPDCDGDTHAPGCPCAALDAQSGGDGASRYFNRLPIEAEDLVPFLYTAKEQPVRTPR